MSERTCPHCDNSIARQTSLNDEYSTWFCDNYCGTLYLKDD